jgi:hypothetical protein
MGADVKFPAEFDPKRTLVDPALQTATKLGE